MNEIQKELLLYLFDKGGIVFTDVKHLVKKWNLSDKDLQYLLALLEHNKYIIPPYSDNWR